MSKLAHLATESDRAFEERFLEKRAAPLKARSLFGVSTSAGRAFSAGQTESHLAWVDVSEEERRSRRRARKEQKVASLQAGMQAGLPPGKQVQCTGSGGAWKDAKQTEDERLAISRRLAVRIEQLLLCREHLATATPAGEGSPPRRCGGGAPNLVRKKA